MMPQGGAWELLNSLYSCNDKGSKKGNKKDLSVINFKVQNTTSII